MSAATEAMESTQALEALHRRVTAAILEAERYPGGSEEKRRAYGLVSQLEEAIAVVAPPDTLEGIVARHGAVLAALRQGDGMRAARLVVFYRSEPALPQDARGELAALLLDTEDPER